MSTPLFSSIPIDLITPDPTQPRRIFDKEPLTELSESIKQHGVVQPILVRPIEGNQYMIVCGERRYRASKEAGLIEIPCIVREITDDEAMEIQIIENLQRRDVHPIEEANAFAQLRTRYEVDEIAIRMGKSIAYVYNRIKLTTLSEYAQSLFYEDRMTIKQAHKLAWLAPELQNEVIKSQIDRYDIDNNEDWKIGNIDYLIERKMSEFDIDIFNPLDADLYPAAGSCVGCQHNTATTPLLFDDDQKPACLNNPCFQIKRSAALEQKITTLASVPNIAGFITSKHTYDSERFEIIKNILAKHSIEVFYTDDYDIVDEPDNIMPREQWFLEEYYGDAEDAEDDDVLTEYSAYVNEIQQQIKEYNEQCQSAIAMISSDYNYRIKPAYAKAKNTTAPAAGTTSTDHRILDLQLKEKRAMQLDEEKLYQRVVQSARNKEGAFYIGKWAQEKVNSFTRKQYVVICLKLYNQLSWDTQSQYNLTHFKNKWVDTNDVIKHFELLVNQDINHLLQLLMIDNMKPFGSASSTISNAASYMLIEELYPSMVADHTSEIEAAAAKRKANLDAKIKSLS